MKNSVRQNYGFNSSKIIQGSACFPPNCTGLSVRLVMTQCVLAPATPAKQRHAPMKLWRHWEQVRSLCSKSVFLNFLWRCWYVYYFLIYEYYFQIPKKMPEAPPITWKLNTRLKELQSSDLIRLLGSISWYHVSLFKEKHINSKIWILYKNPCTTVLKHAFGR